MSEEKVETKIEKEKVEVKDKKVDVKKEVKADVKEDRKVVKKDVGKKESAVARGVGLRVSPKYCKFICRIIKSKSPDVAVVRLQDVIDERRAVPMAGLEVGHKKGMAGGKFPKNACRAVMNVVKQAAANSVVAGINVGAYACAGA